MTCCICGSGDGPKFIVLEMMFGTRRPYEYVECDRCGTLYLSADTENDSLQDYPPSQYYSLTPTISQEKGSVLDNFRRSRFEAIMWNRSFLGALLNYLRPLPSTLKWLVDARPESFSSPILDVGCGKGELLFQLARLGFSKLVGIDPNIESGSSVGHVNLIRGDLSQVEGQFELILFHHSLEHMWRPVESLITSLERLKDGGRIVIRTPIKDCLAWREYGVNWVQIDAPRHRFVISRRGLDELVARVGLKIKHLDYDSTAFQFWASEEYRRGIALTDSTFHLSEKGKALSRSPTIREYQRRAEALNRINDGDQITVILQGKIR